jgi:hypothetical protein
LPHVESRICHFPDAEDSGFFAVMIPRDSRFMIQQGGRSPPHCPEAYTTAIVVVVVDVDVVLVLLVVVVVVGGIVLVVVVELIAGRE